MFHVYTLRRPSHRLQGRPIFYTQHPPVRQMHAQRLTLFKPTDTCEKIQLMCQNLDIHTHTDTHIGTVANATSQSFTLSFARRVTAH